MLYKEQKKFLEISQLRFFFDLLETTTIEIQCTNRNFTIRFTLHSIFAALRTFGYGQKNIYNQFVTFPCQKSLICRKWSLIKIREVLKWSQKTHKQANAN